MSIASITSKIIEATIDKIDMNDLYTRIPEIKSSLTFMEFYNAVKDTDKALAKKIDKWFVDNTKALVIKNIKESSNPKYQGPSSYSQSSTFISSKPTYPEPRKDDYDVDPCMHGGGRYGGRSSC